jgi:hypothetical protein
MAFNRPQVKCPSCKKAVDFGRVFCPLCGAAMNHGNQAPKKIRSAGSNDGGGIVGAVIRSVITIFLLLVIVLLLWPQESDSKIGTVEQAQILRKKINAMDKAIEAEQPFGAKLTEEEINAHLHRIVRAQPKSSSPATPVAEEISIDILDTETMKIYTRTRIWKLVLTHQLILKPGVRENGFSPDIHSAHLGHLPMVSVLRMPVIQKFEKTLINLKQEKELLQNIDVIQIREDEVAFQVQ